MQRTRLNTCSQTNCLEWIGACGNHREIRRCVHSSIAPTCRRAVCWEDIAKLWVTEFSISDHTFTIKTSAPWTNSKPTTRYEATFYLYPGLVDETEWDLMVCFSRDTECQHVSGWYIQDDEFTPVDMEYLASLEPPLVEPGVVADFEMGKFDDDDEDDIDSPPMSPIRPVRRRKKKRRRSPSIFCPNTQAELR